MNKKIIMFLLVVVLTVSGSFYLRTRTVCTTLEEQYQRINKVMFDGSFYNFGPFRANEFDIYQDVISIEELVQKSAIVARVHYTSRQQKYGTFYTSVKIEKLFKGTLQSQEIVIFEPIKINEELLVIEGVHKPIDNHQDYIVFLQGAIPEDNQHFNLVNSCMGLIPVKPQLYVKIKEVNEQDEMTSISKKEFDKYDFFDLHFRSLEGRTVDDNEVYEETKQLFFEQYNILTKKYAGIEGKVIFENE